MSDKVAVILENLAFRVGELQCCISRLEDRVAALEQARTHTYGYSNTRRDGDHK